MSHFILALLIIINFIIGYLLSKKSIFDGIIFVNEEDGNKTIYLSINDISVLNKKEVRFKIKNKR